ncbi:hypothetical protein [Deinococcus pimensis]|uniref:hypothetical protein n=1 Tax=Deinococcus pimensis TaxID=309888 RepID=UPI00047F7EBB|nr:hypothetical protein [Deinococcus pimensis]
MTLWHRKQAERFGCIYHALYAITGDEGVLAHVGDISEARMRTRMTKLGLFTMPVFANHGDFTDATPRAFWDTYREMFAHDEPGHAYLLLSVPSRRVANNWHAVAVKLPNLAADTVEVSDSSEDDVLVYTWPEFLASWYAHAHVVESVHVADLSLYPFEDARARLAEADRAADVEYVM